MKKTLTLAFALLLVFVLAACGAFAPTEAAGDAMTLEEIFATIQKDVPDLPETATTALDESNYQYYLFTETPIEGAQALACDAIINAVAHSAVLVRVADGDDAQAIAETIRENANPNKWICVGAETVEVTVHNKTILLVMSTQETAEAMTANFDALWS
jgi:PBP1b-binding outer membrane lipoprotein LpoB